MTEIAFVTATYHTDETACMLDVAHAEAQQQGLTVTDVVRVPGCFEIPLAVARLLEQGDVAGVAVFGILENGETDHGLVIGQSVTQGLIDLQLEFDAPVGLGIIGPGVEPHQVEPRLEKHARAAVAAIAAMLK